MGEHPRCSAVNVQLHLKMKIAPLADVRVCKGRNLYNHGHL